jgi:nitrogen PTS system EIIA component
LTIRNYLEKAMDLKIKDVAELLNVSETTIRRWLVEGKIPAYRLNHQYRFSRIEIENWMLSCKLKSPEDDLLALSPKQIYPPVSEEETASAQRTGQLQFCLYRALNNGEVYAFSDGETKEEVIRNAMKLTAAKQGFDADVVSELLLDREKLMPTAFNHGVAVPHTRDFVLQGFDMIVVVFPEKPIEYGALDGEAVHTLFFLFSSNDKRHLHLLAKLAHLSSNESALAFLRTKPDKKALLDFVKEWESTIRHIAE